MSLSRRHVLRGALAVSAASLVWTTQVHHLLAPPSSEAARTGPLPDRARASIARMLERARDPDAYRGVRAFNPEWDLLSRMIGGLAIACAGLRDPALAPEARVALSQTGLHADAAARRHGHRHFLLPYVMRGTWRGPERSLFVDGELAVLLGSRLMLGDDPEVREAFVRRVRHVRNVLEVSPLGSGESYPNECWTYCNTTALVALRMAEVLLGQDHQAVLQAFTRGARERLIHEETGLLVSAYTYGGAQVQPPEGSSLWWSAHALRVVDDALAQEQFARARKALFRTRLGFGYALEWPAGVEAHVDIDSGGIVPVLGASPASSGLALVAARSFADEAMRRALWSSVDLAAFPTTEDGAWRIRAGNAVADAVAAYALVQGPVWAQLGVTA